jgi:hypothetical protein
MHAQDDAQMFDMLAVLSNNDQRVQLLKLWRGVEKHRAEVAEEKRRAEVAEEKHRAEMAEERSKAVYEKLQAANLRVLRAEGILNLRGAFGECADQRSSQ